MMVTVNGKEIEWEEGMTVASLLEKCRYTFPLIIVKVNDELVPRRLFQEHSIRDGDLVEAIHLMSGG
jgi:sulfur carrier protein